MEISANQIDTDEINLSDYIAAFRRRKIRMIVTMLLILIISLAVAFGLPAVYQSKGSILIEQQQIPRDMVQSTITTFADQQINILRQRVMTTANLLKLIEKYNLYEDERKTSPNEVVVAQMRDEDISLEPLQVDVVDAKTGRSQLATIAFSVSYNNGSPALAQKVANELITLFLKENLNLILKKKRLN